MKTIKNKKYIDWTMKLWLMTIFISSIVIFPFIKGSTPFFVFSIISFFSVILFGSYYKFEFTYSIIGFSFTYITLCFISQLYLLIFGDSIFVPNDLIFTSGISQKIMRSTLITQFLYLFGCFMFFRFIVIFYDPEKHNKIIIKSLWFFISIGFYIWFFYIIFKTDGDIFSNRIYGEDILNPGHSQLIEIAGLILPRFTSLAGEPSMFVFSILPIYIIFNNLDSEKSFLRILIFTALFLTFSTTFFLGIVLFILLSIYFGENKNKVRFISLIVLLIIIVFFLIQTEAFQEILTKVLLEKLSQNSESGVERSENFSNHMHFFFSLPIFLQLFGMGFGFIRSPEFLSTILVNNGIIGFIIWTSFFFYPIIKLDRTQSNNNLKISIITLYFMLLTSVSEFSYGVVWLILGIAYNKLKREKILHINIIDKLKILYK